MSTDDIVFRWLRISDFHNGYQRLKTVDGVTKRKESTIVKISDDNIDFNPEDWCDFNEEFGKIFPE